MTQIREAAPAKFDKTNSMIAILICCCFIQFLFPVVQINILNSSNCFCYNFFNILQGASFNFNFNGENVIVFFSRTSQIFATISFVLTIFATICHFKKKAWIASSCFFLSSCLPITFLPELNLIKVKLINLQINQNQFHIILLWPFFIFIILNLICSGLIFLKFGIDKLTEKIFLIFAILTLVFVIFIGGHTLINSFPAINKIGIFNCLFNSTWKPSLNQFGIFNLIKASVFATLGSILISAPLGILTAIFMAEFCPKKVLIFLKPMIELLAGVPSVVFGFFGMIIIVPAIKNIFQNFQTDGKNPVVGDSLLAVILVLTLMILPTIVNTSFVALKTVPKRFKEASFGLGATKITTIFKVCVPASKSIIGSGILLATGRAIGETMAVIMVAGNVANDPELLGTVRLLTTGIAIDLAYASGLLKSTLFLIGFVLFGLIIILNLIFSLFFKNKVSF